MAGEWVIWAGDAAPAASSVPTWLAVLLGVAAVVNPAIAAWLTYKATTSGHKTQKQQSNRDMIFKAAELVRSLDPYTYEQGMKMLEGIAQIKGLSEDDFRLVQLLTRQGLERKLELAKQDQRQGRKPRFWRRQGGGRQQR